MKGTVILSHGLESGPQATKVAAMAQQAVALGWREVRPDYCDLDALRSNAALDARIERVIEQLPHDGSPVVLAGSSMGAFCSGLASLRCDCVGLFLLALPLTIPEYPQRFDAARVPTAIVHGWDDELIPVAQVVEFAAARRARAYLVDDSHRLSAHVDVIAGWFRDFLVELSA